mmetsp:Transcript_25041/g.55063  ORF Transcript_25041/g.55063 Transcript_25041/m.55063 type:complete len:235 (+) Transcript_25041:281-985(+)
MSFDCRRRRTHRGTGRNCCCRRNTGGCRSGCLPLGAGSFTTVNQAVCLRGYRLQAHGHRPRRQQRRATQMNGCDGESQRQPLRPRLPLHAKTGLSQPKNQNRKRRRATPWQLIGPQRLDRQNRTSHDTNDLWLIGNCRKKHPGCAMHDNSKSPSSTKYKQAPPNHNNANLGCCVGVAGNKSTQREAERCSNSIQKLRERRRCHADQPSQVVPNRSSTLSKGSMAPRNLCIGQQV